MQFHFKQFWVWIAFLSYICFKNNILQSYNNSVNFTTSLSRTEPRLLGLVRTGRMVNPSLKDSGSHFLKQSGSDISIKGSVSWDFRLPVFSRFEPIWAPDKQAKAISNSVSISPRYLDLKKKLPRSQAPLRCITPWIQAPQCASHHGACGDAHGGVKLHTAESKLKSLRVSGCS